MPGFGAGGSSDRPDSNAHNGATSASTTLSRSSRDNCSNCSWVREKEAKRGVLSFSGNAPFCPKSGCFRPPEACLHKAGHAVKSPREGPVLAGRDRCLRAYVTAEVVVHVQTRFQGQDGGRIPVAESRVDVCYDLRERPRVVDVGIGGGTPFMAPAGLPCP